MSPMNSYNQEPFKLNEQTFDIRNELKIRKILEKNTDWHIEFNENYDNPYEYDLSYFYHKENTKTETGYEKQFRGYIELEVHHNWKTKSIPSYWREPSFLKRKCYKWDYENNKWSNEHKNNYDKTVYLKFNNNLTYCFVLSIPNIIEKGHIIDYRGDPDDYHEAFIGVDKDKIYWGIDNCIEYINNFMEEKMDKEVEFDIPF